MSLKFYSESALVAELGQRLREHRLRRNMLQKTLAEKAGISVSALKKLENDGKVTLESFMKVVFALRLEKEMMALFMLPALSIAQVEALKAPTRQRAAKGKTRNPVSTQSNKNES